MNIYVFDSVLSKIDNYVSYLINYCGYNKKDAETRRCEIEYQIKRRCVSLEYGSKGQLKFKSVLM